MKNTIVEQPQETSIKQPAFNCIPPKQFEYNEFGLKTNVNYIFDDEGYVNWRAMVPVKYLYINPQNKEKIEKKYDKKFDELDIIKDKIQDSDLVITLGGIRFLANLRNFTDVSFEPITANESYAATVCRILWTSCFETLNRSVSFQDTGSASLSTTNSFGKNYLIEIASNRAFCRAVRGFLRIFIVSQGELIPNSVSNQEEINSVNHNSDQNNIISPINILRQLMTEDKIDFDKIKSQMLKKHKDNPEEVARISEYKSIDDLPKNIIFDIIGKIKQLREKKAGTFNPIPE